MAKQDFSTGAANGGAGPSPYELMELLREQATDIYSNLGDGTDLSPRLTAIKDAASNGFMALNGAGLEVRSLADSADLAWTYPDGGSGNPSAELKANGVSAGSYSLATVTVDATGRVTSITSGTTTSGGEANVGENLGAGSGLYASKSAATLQFKSLVAGTGVTLTPSSTTVTIAATVNETNTGSSLGAGSAVFAGKVGVDLQFKSLVQGSGVTLTSDANTVTIAAAAAAVSSVFSRTGAVVAAASDYDAAQVDFAPAGSIAAVNVQSAIEELDAEKLALAGGSMTGALSMLGSAVTAKFQLGSNADTEDGTIQLNRTDDASMSGARSMNFLSNVGTIGFWHSRLSPVRMMALTPSGVTLDVPLTISSNLTVSGDATLDSLTVSGDATLDSLTVDFTTVGQAGEHAEEIDANATGTITIQATDPTVLRRTLTGDVTLHVAGAPTPGKGWSTELRTTQDGTGGRDLTILPANLLTYTEQFDNAAWTKSSVSVTADSGTAPDGRVSSDSVAADSTGSFRYFRQAMPSASGAGLTYTLSAHAKPGTTSVVYLLLTDLSNDAIGRYFDLSSVSVGNGTGLDLGTNVTFVSASIEAASNGFYRISLTVTTVDAVTYSFGVGVSDANGSTVATSGIAAEFWGAQLVQGSDPLGYIGVGATRAASVVWRGGTAAEIDYAAQAAAAESRIIIGVGSDGEILIDDVSVEA